MLVVQRQFDRVLPGLGRTLQLVTRARRLPSQSQNRHAQDVVWGQGLQGRLKHLAHHRLVTRQPILRTLGINAVMQCQGIQKNDQRRFPQGTHHRQCLLRQQLFQVDTFKRLGQCGVVALEQSCIDRGQGPVHG